MLAGSNFIICFAQGQYSASGSSAAFEPGSLCCFISNICNQCIYLRFRNIPVAGQHRIRMGKYFRWCNISGSKDPSSLLLRICRHPQYIPVQIICNRSMRCSLFKCRVPYCGYTSTALISAQDTITVCGRNSETAER